MSEEKQPIPADLPPSAEWSLDDHKRRLSRALDTLMAPTGDKAVLGLPNENRWGVCYLNAALLNLAYIRRWIIERLLLEMIDRATRVDGREARVMELPRQLCRVGLSLMEVLVELRCNPRHESEVDHRKFLTEIMTLCGNDSPYPIRGGGNGLRVFALLLQLIEKFAPVAVDQIFSSKFQTWTHKCRVGATAKNGIQMTCRIFSASEADIPCSRSRGSRTTTQKLMEELIDEKKSSERCPCGELSHEVSFGDCIVIAMEMSSRNCVLQKDSDGRLADKRDTFITVGDTLHLGKKDYELSTVIVGYDEYSDDGSRSGGHEWAQIRLLNGQVYDNNNGMVTKVERSKLETETPVIMAIYAVRAPSHPDPLAQVRILRREKEILRREGKTLRQENENLQQEKETLRQETETLRRENEILRQEKEILRQEKEILRQEKETLRQKILRQAKKIESLTKKFTKRHHNRR